MKKPVAPALSAFVKEHLRREEPAHAAAGHELYLVLAIVKAARALDRHAMGEDEWYGLPLEEVEAREEELHRAFTLLDRAVGE